MSLYAIGDVQGCWDSLAALLAQIGAGVGGGAGGGTQLWLAGDLVNRGPRSLDVLRWAMREERAGRVTAVLGNHDLHLLARVAGVRPRGKRDTLEEVLAAPDRDELVDWLRHRPLLHREGDRLMVHAGLVPAWTADQAEELAREVEAELRGPSWTRMVGALADAPAAWRARMAPAERRALALSALVSIRTVHPGGAMERRFSGPPGEAPPGCVPWFDHPARRSRDVRVVCGHWAALGLVVRPDLAALDTGCVWGERLTALRLEDDQVVQQEALEPRSPRGSSAG